MRNHCNHLLKLGLVLLIFSLAASAFTPGTAIASAPTAPDSDTITTPGDQWTGAPGIRAATSELMAQDGTAQPIPTESPVLASPQPSALLTSLTPALGWAGPSLSEYTSVTHKTFFPPDAMGAAGPNEFFVTLNSHYRAYDKTTGLSNGVNLLQNSFWNPVRNNAGVTNPHVRYDRLSGRWFVTALTIDYPNRVLIAVSDGSRVTTSTHWTFYSFSDASAIPTNESNCTISTASLGIDANALYIGVSISCGQPLKFNNSAGYVLRKSALLSGSPIVVTAFRNLATRSNGVLAPQGVDNDDSSAIQGYFIGVDIGQRNVLDIYQINNPGGSPTISAKIQITTAAASDPILVPHLNNDRRNSGRLDPIDLRLFAAQIRNGRLWTAQNIGVDAHGNASSSPSRNGVRWYEIGALNSNKPAVAQWGTVYDGSITNPLSFWIPTIAVNGQGHAAAGFSYAGVSSYPGVMFASRLANDAPGMMNIDTPLKAGAYAYNPPDDKGNPKSGRQWGQYSYTSVDPCDNMTIWTVQEYAASTNNWGVWINKLLAPPPATPTSTDPAQVLAGLPSVDVTINGLSSSGSGFYDPGSDFACRIAATIPGIVVNSITYNSPTQVTLNLNTTGALPGLRDVTITNPDGQSATGAGSLSVIGPVAGSLTSSQNPATYGDLVTFTANLGANIPGTIHFYDGTVRIGSVSVQAGQAAFSTSGLTAGSHNVTAVYDAGSSGYQAAPLNALTQQINPATLQVAVADANKVYGAPLPVFTYTASGFVINETQAVLSGTPDIATTASASSPVGAYPVTIGPGSLSAANYIFSFTPGWLTVTQANSTTKLTLNPNPALVGQAVTITADVSGQYPAGSVPSGSITITVDSQHYPLTLDNAGHVELILNTLTAGSHTVKAEYAGDSNYTASTDTQQQQVNLLDVTITFSNLEYTYDGMPHSAQIDVSPSLPIQVTYAGSPSLPVNAGSYLVVATVLDPNYSGASSSATLVIHKAQLTVKALDQTSEYGEALPAFEAAFSGFVNNETETVLSGAPGFNSAATQNSPVGEYVILPTVGDLTAANYDFAFSAGKLVISKAMLTVTANSLTKIYGVPLPTLTASYLGFKLNDDASVLTGMPELTTDATATSNVGKYTISVNQGELSSVNYNFTFVTGLLEIQPAPTGTVLSVSNLVVMYGQPVTFNVTVTPGTIPVGGLVILLDGTSVLQTLTLDLLGQATWTTTSLPVGIHTITARYNGSDNYYPSTSLVFTVNVLNADPTFLPYRIFVPGLVR